MIFSEMVAASENRRREIGHRSIENEVRFSFHGASHSKDSASSNVIHCQGEGKGDIGSICGERRVFNGNANEFES